MAEETPRLADNVDLRLVSMSASDAAVVAAAKTIESAILRASASFEWIREEAEKLSFQIMLISLKSPPK